MINANKKIILRVKGGLGNQLFIYAFGYSLAKKNNYDLYLDYTTGFLRDHKYKRHYMLNKFNISSKMASKKDMMIPFDRLRRIPIVIQNKFLNLKNKSYIINNEQNFKNT